MNETLSDSQITNWKVESDSLSPEATWPNASMAAAINTIEALQVEVMSKEAWIHSIKMETIKRLEAKDAQIKQLVEALEKIKRCNFSCDDTCGIQVTLDISEQALSTIPDVEGYRIEQEEQADINAQIIHAANKRIHELKSKSKTHNKRLCDEIVGKIEARYNKDCNSNQEYFVGFCVGLLKAIDIVKSVLGGQ